MMRLLLICALLGLPVAASGQSRLDAEAAALLQEALVTTADDFILPAYAAQSAASQDLVIALDAYCRADGGIDAVHGGFAATFLAWQRSSIVNVGPIAKAEGPMRVQLWPDPKGFSARAIRAALSAEDPALLAPGGLQGRSIALTNLTALEALVYAPLAPVSYGCDLATAIAVFQADLAVDLVEGWTPGSPYRTLYDSAASGNARYRAVDDLVRDVLAGAVVYVDRLRKFKLLRGLGEAAGGARPERTEAVASGLGLNSIAVGFATLRDLYDTPFGLFDAAPEIGGSMEYYVLAQTAGAMANDLALVDQSLPEIAAADGSAAANLRRMAEALLRQEQFLKSGFTGAIGLTAGFTAADGD